jgi:hypothetical protein
MQCREPDRCPGTLTSPVNNRPILRQTTVATDYLTLATVIVSSFTLPVTVTFSPACATILS